MYSAASTGIHGKNMIVRGWYKHYTEVQITGSRRTIPTPRIQLWPSDPTIPFKLCSRRFAIKIAFPMTVNKAQGQMINRVEIYQLSLIFFPIAISMRNLPPASSFHSAGIENAHKMIGNIKHCISRSALYIHIHKSLLNKYFVVSKCELFACVQLIPVRELPSCKRTTLL